MISIFFYPINFFIRLIAIFFEKEIEYSSWSSFKTKWGLDYNSIKEAHLQGKMGEVMTDKGLDCISNIYSYAIPKFRVGQKLDSTDIEILQHNPAFIMKIGREGVEDRFHGVLIKGRCYSCGNVLQYHYGCPKCRSLGHGYYSERNS